MRGRGRQMATQINGQMVHSHNPYFFSSLNQPTSQQQKPVWRASAAGRVAIAAQRYLSTPGAIPQLNWDLRCCSSKRQELKRRLPGARRGVCHERAAALTGEAAFNVKERQHLPRIRDLRVGFFPLPVSQKKLV